MVPPASTSAVASAGFARCVRTPLRASKPNKYNPPRPHLDRHKQKHHTISLPTLMAGTDVAINVLSFLRTADLGRLLQASRALYALLRGNSDSSTTNSTKRLWTAVLAADWARYGIPPGLAAGGWAAGRELVRPPTVRWCLREPQNRRYDDSDDEETYDDDFCASDDSCGAVERPVEGEKQDRSVLEVVDDPFAPGRAFRVGDVKPKPGQVFDPEGGPGGIGALYRLGGMWDEAPASDARVWDPVNKWRTLRIRGRYVGRHDAEFRGRTARRDCGVSYHDYHFVNNDPNIITDRSPPPRSDPSIALVRTNRGRDRALVGAASFISTQQTRARTYVHGSECKVADRLMKHHPNIATIRSYGVASSRGECAGTTCGCCRSRRRTRRERG